MAAARVEGGSGRNTGSPAGGVARANGQPARVRSGRSGWRRSPYYRGSRVMPVEGRGFRWKRWRKVEGSREWLTPITPMNEQQDRTSSHAQAKGTTTAVAVVRASTGLTTHRSASVRVRVWCHARETRPLVATGKPVCEPHDSTGEPGAGNRPAGFGERGEETCPRESACGPVAKAPDEPPIPTGYAPPLDSTGDRDSAPERRHRNRTRSRTTGNEQWAAAGTSQPRVAGWLSAEWT